MTEVRTFDYRVSALVRAIDGDTYILTVERVVDFGFYLVELKQWSGRFRLLGIDAPEKSTPRGPAATAYATAWLTAAIDAGVLRGQTFKTDDFGRWLISLYRMDTGESLTACMIDAGHGVPYTK